MRAGIAFDLEGTSVDLEVHHHEAHVEAACSLGIGIDKEFALANVEHFIGGPDEKVAADIFELGSHAITLNREQFIEEFLRRDRAFYEKRLESAEIQPREGLVDFIDWLRGKNLSFSIGTLTEESYAKRILEGSGLDKVFGTNVIVREDVKELKPAADVYLKTASIMGCIPEMQIVFEDSPRGVTAALLAGSQAIGMPVIDRDFAFDNLWQAGASNVFDSWKDPGLKSFVTRLLSIMKELRAEESSGPEPNTL